MWNDAEGVLTRAPDIMSERFGLSGILGGDISNSFRMRSAGCISYSQHPTATLDEACSWETRAQRVPRGASGKSPVESDSFATSRVVVN